MGLRDFWHFGTVSPQACQIGVYALLESASPTLSLHAMNSEAPDNAGPVDIGGITPGQLRAYIERIERLTEEKDALASDIRDIYAEAKGNGFDVKVMRKVISLRKMDSADRIEQDEILDLYKRALGMG